MKISHIHIKNVLGIEDLEFAAGQFNEASGRNGQGKTSVLEAIKAAVAPDGHDATLLRKGAEKGEVVLVLDDGTGIRRRIGPAASESTVKRDGKVVNKPVDALRKLVDLTSVNPVDFLRATKKDRARVLLESMPLAVDQAKLIELAGVDLKLSSSAQGLAVIEAYRTKVYDDRTGTNRAVKEKESTVKQLHEALPDAPGGVEGNEDTLRGKVAEAQATRDTTLGKIAAKISGIREANAGKVSDIRAKLADDIRQLEQLAQAEINAITGDTSDNEAKAASARERANQAYADAAGPLTQAIAAIVSNRDAAAKRQATLENIATMEAELTDLREEAEGQNAALDAIDAYKAELLNALPIPGLEVRDGDIFRNGVQFDRLNTQQQVEIAVEIAKLRAGDLPVLCVDGLELLDNAHYEALKESALASGLQLFVSRVSNDEFAIKTE